MKVLNKIFVAILTILMCASILALLISFNVFGVKELVLIDEFLTSNVYIHCLTIAISVILVVITVTYILSNNNNNSKPIILQGENGELIITRETIESIANNVTKAFTGTREISTRLYVNNKEEVSLNIFMQVEQGIEISELVKNLQISVKEEVKKITEIEVVNVNVKIKNISNKKEEKTAE